VWLEPPGRCAPPVLDQPQPIAAMREPSRDRPGGPLKLDAAYLKRVGLGVLPPEEANLVLTHVYETLELRVGVELSRRMTNAQFAEFELYFDARDDDGAFKWIQTNFPDYREIVSKQLEIVTAELASAAPVMLALIGSSG
jgi:Protein of unknown function (DUF5663)